LRALCNPDTNLSVVGAPHICQYLNMSAPSRHRRIVPLIIAFPLFLQNLDTTVMSTALPAMAHSLQVPVLHLNIAIAAYVLSLAVFLPASAWLAHRFGARRIFCSAVLVFTLGSALCGMAHTLGQLVACRLFQGAGGAMMVPVGRSILLQSVPAGEMVKAMVWFSLPGAIGRLTGPLVGGLIVTIASWPWIFLVNIPFGVTGTLLALKFVDEDAPLASRGERPFDVVGLALMPTALGGILGSLELAGKGLLSAPNIVMVALAGLLSLGIYLRRSSGQEFALLDFGVLRYPTFRIALLGGFPIRVAIGAAPFLLPLMLQIGFGLTPMRAGSLVMELAIAF